MTRWTRRRVTAAAVLGFWIGGILLQSAGVHVPDTADAGGYSDLLWSAAQATKIDRGQSATDDHCGICHLQRAFRSAVPSITSTIAQVMVSTNAVSTERSRPRSSAVESHASRGPPATL